MSTRLSLTFVLLLFTSVHQAQEFAPADTTGVARLVSRCEAAVKVDADSALRICRSALATIGRKGAAYDRAVVLAAMGRYELGHGKAAAGKGHLKAADAAFGVAASEEGVADTERVARLERWAAVRIAKSDHARALVLLEEAMGLASGSTERERLMRLSIEQAVAMRDAGKAVALTEQFQSMRDSLREQGLRTTLDSLQARYKADLEQVEANTTQEKKDRQEERDVLRFHRMILSGLLLVLALALIIVLLQRRPRNVRGQEDPAIVHAIKPTVSGTAEQVLQPVAALSPKAFPALHTQPDPLFIQACLLRCERLLRDQASLEALALIQQLGSLLRTNAEHAALQSIALDAEMAALRSFLKIASQVSGALRFEVNATPELSGKDARMPTLIMQPFLQYLVWNGETPKGTERSITILFSNGPGGMRCTMVDNGIVRKSADDALTMHLNAIHDERLEVAAQRMQQKGSFVINDLKDANGGPAGTEVVIELKV